MLKNLLNKMEFDSSIFNEFLEKSMKSEISSEEKENKNIFKNSLKTQINEGECNFS